MAALETDERLTVAGEEVVNVTIVTGRAIRDCVETPEDVEVAVEFDDGSPNVVKAFPTYDNEKEILTPPPKKIHLLQSGG